MGVLQYALHVDDVSLKGGVGAQRPLPITANVHSHVNKEKQKTE